MKKRFRMAFNLNEPNKNGRVYTGDLTKKIDKAIAQGRAYVTYHDGNVPPYDERAGSVPVGEIAGVIKETDEKGNELSVGASMLATPAGDIVKHMMDEDVEFEFLPRGVGWLESDGKTTKVTEYTFISCDLVPKGGYGSL